MKYEKDTIKLLETIRGIKYLNGYKFLVPNARVKANIINTYPHLDIHVVSNEDEMLRVVEKERISAIKTFNWIVQLDDKVINLIRKELPYANVWKPESRLYA